MYSYSNRLTPICVDEYSAVDMEMGQDSRDVGLPDGEVRSDACSPPEPKRVGFHLIDATVRSYPPFRGQGARWGHGKFTYEGNVHGTVDGGIQLISGSRTRLHPSPRTACNE